MLTVNGQMNFSWVHLYISEGQLIFLREHIFLAGHIGYTDKHHDWNNYSPLLLKTLPISSNNCSFPEKGGISMSLTGSVQVPVHCKRIAMWEGIRHAGIWECTRQLMR